MFSALSNTAVFAAGHVLAAALRIGVGRWSDVVGSRVRPLRLVGVAIAAPLELVPLDELRRQLEVNVVGQVAVTQAFLPMKKLDVAELEKAYEGK